MATFILVTTLAAVVPASKQAEMHIVKDSWIIGYIFVYLILADSYIYKHKRKTYRIVEISSKLFTYCAYCVMAYVGRNM
jgi:hypothetical protein